MMQMELYMCSIVFFFFKQKTAYEMRISDWSSDVCSSDLYARGEAGDEPVPEREQGSAADDRAGRQAGRRTSMRFTADRQHRLGRHRHAGRHLQMTATVQWQQTQRARLAIVADHPQFQTFEIGRASARERGCTSG